MTDNMKRARELGKYFDWDDDSEQVHEISKALDEKDAENEAAFTKGFNDGLEVQVEDAQSVQWPSSLVESIEDELMVKIPCSSKLTDECHETEAGPYTCKTHWAANQAFEIIKSRLRPVPEDCVVVSRAELERVIELVNGIRCEGNNDTVKTTTEDDEIEYWINEASVQNQCDTVIDKLDSLMKAGG